MHSNSDQRPEVTVQSNNKTQVNFNIIETTKTGMDGKSRTSYEYEYVEVEGEVTKEKIIEAILAADEVKPEPEPEPVKPVEIPVEIDTVMVLEAVIEGKAAKVEKPEKPVKEGKE